MEPRQRESLLVRDLGDEILVYDLESHRASCLNPGAAEVFRACDGRRTLDEIAAVCARGLGRPVGAPYVALALERLARAGLVDARLPVASAGRREALRRLAATAAVALPAISSVLAPEPAQAQTCLPNGSMCVRSAQCCSGCCMDNFMCTGGMNSCM